MYSIGDVSKKVGIKIPTLRYYEQAGLIPEPDRSVGKQRRYSDSDLERLAFVKHARQLGFSLAAIASLIALSENTEEDCNKIHELADTHLTTVRAKLKLLKDLEQELQRIVIGCNSGQVEACYIIQSLANHEWCESDHEEAI
jgi:DNA-binding transcriptional MerR regulator